MFFIMMKGKESMNDILVLIAVMFLAALAAGGLFVFLFDAFSPKKNSLRVNKGTTLVANNGYLTLR